VLSAIPATAWLLVCLSIHNSLLRPLLAQYWEKKDIDQLI